MTIAAASFEAQSRLKGSMTLCSWKAGWRSLLLRSYDEPQEVDDLITAPTPDQLIVLVLEGDCRIEGRYSGRWQKAHYMRGDIGMTAPHEEVQLRWREGRRKKTLQLHLPATSLSDVASLDPGKSQTVRLPHQLIRSDPMMESVLRRLERAAGDGISELYADSAAHFLISHVMQFHSGAAGVAATGDEPRRMALANALLRESIGSNLTLGELASATGMSKFHLLRVFKQAFGETPFRRLTRYRMEAAQRLLRDKEATVSSVAYRCGYDNPTHFATAFRRFLGVSPKAYRASVAGRPHFREEESQPRERRHDRVPL